MIYVQKAHLWLIREPLSVICVSWDHTRLMLEKLVVSCALPEDISPTKAQQTVYRVQLAHQARKVARSVLSVKQGGIIPAQEGCARCVLPEDISPTKAGIIVHYVLLENTAEMLDHYGVKNVNLDQLSPIEV